MTCLDRTPPSIVAAVGVILCGCPMDNPGFFDSEGASGAGTTDAGTTTDASGTTSSTTTTGGGSGSTGTSTTTSGAATSSTSDMTTGVSAPDTSTSDPGTTTESTGEGTSDMTTGVGGCNDQVDLVIDAIEDAFFLSGATDGGNYCKYYDPPADAMSPCKELNYGITAALRFARMDGGITSMMAIRFPHQPIADLKMLGQEILDVRVRVTLYDALYNTNKDVILNVGKIKEEWVAGTRDGKVAGDPDSNFDYRNVGVKAGWSGDDGPRGASAIVSKLVIPYGYPDHAEVESEAFTIEDWIDDPLNKNHGVVLTYSENQELVNGPGIKAVESGVLGPKLVVRHCTP
ncbi:MAG: hypothetical protein R3B09_09820 [Nannocystaceae bacterium]